MRPVPGLVLVLVLVLPTFAPGGLAQDEGPPQALGAPVQTVVDAVPRVASRAIQEARFDGTPDAAEAIVRQMEVFTTGFAAGGSWPEGTEAADWPVNDWLVYAVEVSAAAAVIPRRVGTLERTDARCASWFQNATTETVRQWGRDVRQAELAVTALIGSLDDLVARAPPVIDPAPLREARRVLSEWVAASGPRVVECLVAAEADRGLEEEPVLLLRAAPTTVWPYATLRLSGGSNVAAGSKIRIVSEPLRLDANVTLDGNRTFQTSHVLPKSVPLGGAVVTARYNETLADTARVDVVRVPTRLLVAAPERVEPGAGFSVRVDVVPTADKVRALGTVRLSGGYEAEAPLVNGTATFRLTAPVQNGTVAFAVRYPGTPLFAPSEVERVVTVGTLRVDRGAFAREAPAKVDWVAVAVAAVVVAVALLAVAGIPRALRRRRPPAGAAWDQELPPPLPPSGPLVRVFALFYAWAVKLGWARASDTPREMAAKTGDQRIERSAREFERVRYGGEPERPERSRSVTAWLRRVWGERTKREE